MTDVINNDVPRLPPRPVFRPAVDPSAAQAFGRPDDVAGSFGPRRDTPGSSRVRVGDPKAVLAPNPVVAEAYGRPADSAESLQRDPDATSAPAPEAAPEDPWRDPDAPVRLGAPGAETPVEPPLPPGPKLGVRDVLFGRRVAPKALIALAVVALAIGAVGGILGRTTAEVTGALTSQKVSLVPAEEGAQPQNQVARVAKRGAPVRRVHRGCVG